MDLAKLMLKAIPVPKVLAKGPGDFCQFLPLASCWALVGTTYFAFPLSLFKVLLILLCVMRLKQALPLQKHLMGMAMLAAGGCVYGAPS